MPVWSVTEPSLNLWLNDTPLFYNPSRGSAISFRLLYKNEMDFSENSESKDYSTSVFSVGPGGATPWRPYLKRIDPTHAFSFFHGLGGEFTLTNHSPTA